MIGWRGSLGLLVFLIALQGEVLAGTNIDIQKPAGGSEFHEGDEVAFWISYKDTLDIEKIVPPITHKVLSDIDGDITGKIRILGYAGVLNTGGMSQGKHAITIKLADAGSTTGEDLVSITILEPKEGEPFKVSYKGLLEKSARMDEEGRFVIDPTTTDMEKTAITINVKDPEAAAEQEIKVVEHTGFTGGETPAGTARIEADHVDDVLSIFVEIDAPDIEVEWTIIEIGYDPQELVAKDLSEDDLRVIWYGEDEDIWFRLEAGDPEWVLETGVDKENNKVYVKTTHFSVYGIASSVYGQSASVYGQGASVYGQGASIVQTTEPPTPTLYGEGSDVETETPTPATSSPPPVTEPAPEPEKKGICGPGSLLLLSLMVLPLRRTIYKQ